MLSRIPRLSGSCSGGSGVHAEGSHGSTGHWLDCSPWLDLNFCKMATATGYAKASNVRLITTHIGL